MNTTRKHIRQQARQAEQAAQRARTDHSRQTHQATAQRHWALDTWLKANR